MRPCVRPRRHSCRTERSDVGVQFPMWAFAQASFRASRAPLGVAHSASTRKRSQPPLRILAPRGARACPHRLLRFQEEPEPDARQRRRHDPPCSSKQRPNSPPNSPAYTNFSRENPSFLIVFPSGRARGLPAPIAHSDASWRRRPLSGGRRRCRSRLRAATDGISRRAHGAQ